jgi:hypothetical protein
MPAAAAATVSTGDEIEFSKYAVFAFFIVVQAFDQVPTPAGKWKLFFLSNQLVEFLQAIRAEAIIKSVRQEGFGFIAQSDSGTGT